VACKDTDTGAKKLERAAFSTTIPGGKVLLDVGMAGLGEYEADDGSQHTRVAWEGGGVGTMEQIELGVRSMGDNFGVDKVEVTRDLGDRMRWASAIGLVPEPNEWVAMTSIACLQTSVTVRISFRAQTRGQVQTATEKALRYFKCLGESPAGYEGFQHPTVTLDESYGYFENDTFLLLVRATGETLFVFNALSSIVERAKSDAGRMALGYGSVLGMRLRVVDEIRAQKGAGGVSQWTVAARSETPTGEQRAVVAGFECPQAGQGYLVIAASEAGIAQTDIAQLVAKLGCPDESAPGLETRKSACAVGVTELCP
jgi:hypothetical protein